MRYIIRYPQEPQQQIPEIYRDALQQTHVLIAGQTGSGKSVIVNGIIQCALLQHRGKVQFILIDPKMIELNQYKKFPHVIQYGNTPDNMIKALETAEEIMMDRYAALQKDTSRKSYDGSHIYIVIDELADLLETCKKAVAPILSRILRLGRAANIHLIAATQYLGDTIPREIKRNFTATIGLHTRTAQDSYWLLNGFTGCEKLSRGEALYIRPGDAQPQKIRIPYAGDEAQAAETKRLFKWWTDSENIRPDETDPEYIKQQRRAAASEKLRREQAEKRAQEKAEFEYWQSMPMWKRIIKGYYG